MLHEYKMIIYANYLEFLGIEKALHISDNIYHHLIVSASEAAMITISNIYGVLILIYVPDLINSHSNHTWVLLLPFRDKLRLRPVK